MQMQTNPPPPPQYLMQPPPPLQSKCHYIVNLYVKIWHVRLRGANNMHLLSLGGTNEKDQKTVVTRSYGDLFHSRCEACVDSEK